MTSPSLNDPAELARADAALEAVWSEVRCTIPASAQDRERARIARLVAEFEPLALDEEDLRQNVLHHFRYPA